MKHDNEHAEEVAEQELVSAAPAPVDDSEHGSVHDSSDAEARQEDDKELVEEELTTDHHTEEDSGAESKEASDEEAKEEVDNAFDEQEFMN